MVKKCDAKCDAHQFSAPIHLWLRNNIFYCRMELPRINGKRSYKRISLHTDNYYEAKNNRHLKTIRSPYNSKQIFVNLNYPLIFARLYGIKCLTTYTESA